MSRYAITDIDANTIHGSISLYLGEDPEANVPTDCSASPPDSDADLHYGSWVKMLPGQDFSSTACPSGTSLLEWHSEDDYKTYLEYVDERM